MDTKRRYELEAIEYIAKIADGGLRDAITLMDKCLSYSEQLTLENVVKALGTVDYNVMIQLTDTLTNNEPKEMIGIIEEIHNSGKDIKQFLKNYMQFLLDVNKWQVGCDWKYLGIPKLEEYEEWIKKADANKCWKLLDVVVKLNSQIKYSQTPKYDIEAELMLFAGGEEE